MDFKSLREGPNAAPPYWHDLIDWVVGYVFEVAKTCAGGLGCNEYMFERQEGR